MKRTITFITALALTSLAVMRAAEVAKPKPVNPNTWIKAETDHTDAIYKCGEKVVFRVSLADKAPSVPAELAWSLTLDEPRSVQKAISYQFNSITHRQPNRR